MEQLDSLLPIEQLIWAVLIVISGLSIRRMILQKSKVRDQKSSWFRIEDVEEDQKWSRYSQYDAVEIIFFLARKKIGYYLYSQKHVKYRHYNQTQY